jgi:hypothetical protein
VETFEFAAAELPPDAKQADYAYRSGVLKWDVAQGLWGIMRVHSSDTGQSDPQGSL